MGADSHAARAAPRLTFVMNRHHRSYAPELSMDEKVHMIANAHGFLGPCRDYLTETRASLDTLGIGTAISMKSHAVSPR